MANSIAPGLQVSGGAKMLGANRAGTGIGQRKQPADGGVCRERRDLWYTRSNRPRVARPGGTLRGIGWAEWRARPALAGGFGCGGARRRVAGAAAGRRSRSYPGPEGAVPGGTSRAAPSRCRRQALMRDVRTRQRRPRSEGPPAGRSPPHRQPPGR